MVANELAKLRTMNIADISSLPEESHREIEKTWKRRRSISVYAEKGADDAVRVIVKAFESSFPHVSSKAHADGFRVSRQGQFEELTATDKATLY
jgi:hypothetical protein